MVGCVVSGARTSGVAGTVFVFIEWANSEKRAYRLLVQLCP
jgi:hypothetical protein